MASSIHVYGFPLRVRFFEQKCQNIVYTLRFLGQCCAAGQQNSLNYVSDDASIYPLSI